MIEEQLKSYMQLELRLLTTPCIIIETEKLGSKLQSVAQKLKSLSLYKCGHEKNPLSGAECIKAMVKENHYVVATQDRDLQDWMRCQVGIALLYLHNVVPHLDEPSDASKKFVSRRAKALTKVSSFEDERLSALKQKEGLLKESIKLKAKKRKSSGPNPLSCKKKKLLERSPKVQNKANDKNKQRNRKKNIVKP